MPCWVRSEFPPTLDCNRNRQDFHNSFLSSITVVTVSGRLVTRTAPNYLTLEPANGYKILQHTSDLRRSRKIYNRRHMTNCFLHHSSNLNIQQPMCPCCSQPEETR